MFKKRFLIWLLTIPVVLSVTFLIGAAHVQRTSSQPAADPTCSSSNPCIVYQNNSNGSALRGVSVSGVGVAGWTEQKSTSPTNGWFGVYGKDVSTSGTFNSGVEGLSVRGTGVSGVSTNATGVAGTGGSIGVKGIGTATGSTGIEGDSGPGGTAILARTSSGYLFEGIVAKNTPIVVDGLGDTFISGIFSSAGTAYIGSTLVTSGDLYGVQSTVTGTHSDGAGIYSQTNNPQSWIFLGFSDFHNAYTFQVADDGTVFAKGYQGLSTARTLQKTSAGHSLATYAPQVSQPTLEDFGEAQLVNGVANVALEAKFADAIDRTARYLVMLTPEGDCRGLYVALRSPSGFMVRELQGGRSSIAFSYRIVAKPFGDNSPRLPETSMPQGFIPSSERPPHLSLPRRPLVSSERR